ncbi:MAG: SAV_6107 family HEPN domain-containing protein [Dermatophilaceae bacterium]
MTSATTTLQLLDRAHDAIAAGYTATAASQRYLAASLAALRAAAALLAGAPAGSIPRLSAGSGPHDVWALAATTAPELTEWSQRFSLVTGRRVAVETGLVRVSPREADDLLRDAETFVDLAAASLGVPWTRPGYRLVPARSA